MPTKIVAFVLRSRDKHQAAQFYKELGLDVKESQHGGPKHYEIGPSDSQCVVEVYTASKTFDVDALALGVDSLDDALKVVRKYDLEVLEVATEIVYVKDPEGRVIVLLKNNS